MSAVPTSFPRLWAGGQAFRQWLTHGFFKASAMLFVLSLAGSALNMACRILLGRMLTSEQYGEMEAMLQVAAYVGVPVSALQFVVAHEVAKARGEGRSDRIGAIVWSLSLRMGIYALTAMVLLALVAEPVRLFFKLNSAWPVLVTASIVLSVFLLSVVAGGMQGGHRFWQSGVAWLSGPLTRLVLSYFLIKPGFGATGALAAHSASCYIMSGFGLLFMWDLIRGRDRAAAVPFRRILTALWPVMVTLFVFALLGGVDIFIVKRAQSTWEAGDYARVSAVVRIALYMVGTLMTALFPWVVSEKAGGRTTGHLLNKALLVGLAIGIGSALAFTLFPGFILRIFYAEIDANMIRWTRLMAWAMVPTGLINLMLQYQMARWSFSFLGWMIPLSLGYAGLLYRYRLDTDGLIVAMGIASVVIAAVLMAYLVAAGRRAVQAEEGSSYGAA